MRRIVVAWCLLSGCSTLDAARIANPTSKQGLAVYTTQGRRELGSCGAEPCQTADSCYQRCRPYEVCNAITGLCEVPPCPKCAPGEACEPRSHACQPITFDGERQR